MLDRNCFWTQIDYIEWLNTSKGQLVRIEYAYKPSLLVCWISCLLKCMSEVLWSMVKYYKADESCKILTNISEWLGDLEVSYPIHSHFSSKVLDVRSDQIWSTDTCWIRRDKLLHSYPVHITSYNIKHCLFPPFSISSLPVYQLCLLPAMFYWSVHLWLTSGLCLTSNKCCLYIAILCA